MIKQAIKNLKDRKGASKQAILKYIVQNYKLGENLAKINAHLRIALKRGVTDGSFKQSAGTGASGRFRLPEGAVAAKKVHKKKAASPKKSPAKKAKKPKVSKPKPKKSTASPKKSSTKAKKPKATKPKKAKAAKSPSKKAAKPKKTTTKRSERRPPRPPHLHPRPPLEFDDCLASPILPNYLRISPFFGCLLEILYLNNHSSDLATSLFTCKYTNPVSVTHLLLFFYPSDRQLFIHKISDTVHQLSSAYHFDHRIELV